MYTFGAHGLWIVQEAMRLDEITKQVSINSEEVSTMVSKSR